MNKPEILDFLELPDESTDNDIAVRLKDKLIYFNRLLESVSNDFLRKRYLMNIEKIKEVQKEYGFSEPEEVFKSYSNQNSAAQKPKPDKGIPTVAWLIRHTENQASKTFSLFSGANYIGRSSAGIHNILIEDDPYVSRVHAVIYVENNASPTFYIQDDATSNNGKQSKNGTFINGDERRITHKTRLFNNDTVQIGMTKLVLKLNNDQINNIVTQVEDSGYMKTVVINIF